jgi:hypothetical protein
MVIEADSRGFISCIKARVTRGKGKGGGGGNSQGLTGEGRD